MQWSFEALDFLIEEDSERGAQVATAIATYAGLIRPDLDELFAEPLSDDVWRVKAGRQGVSKISSGDPCDAVGGNLLGYAYDFAHDSMSDAQRAEVRSVIATATRGRVWMGARLPRHFRNWNWIAVGLQQPLLSLANEGEEGFDPRVYKLGVEIARDYLTYSISPHGQATEAVGYTQVGLVWGNPFFVAASRRGENLLVHCHHRAMLDSYLHSLEPGLDHFTSHGDGGDGPFEGDFHMIEPLLWASDSMVDAFGRPLDYADGSKLGLPTLAVDPLRGSLNAGSSWHRDAASVQFECSVDSVGASHEHADRGNFTFYAHGRRWALASRSVAPDFRIMLFPHRHGDPLPVATWNPDRTRLTIEMAGRRHTISLRNDIGGTNLAVE